MMRRMKDGSMTVEAVFVMAVLLLTFMWIMSEAIALYQQSADIKREWVDLKELAERFRVIEMGKKLLP